MSKLSSNTSRMVLPNISSSSTPSLSYTQRYQHMTKLANYNQLNQGQIWKQYQKLRQCLKQINQQVLYHMQRKAYTNFNKQKQSKPQTKDSQATLILLQDQKKTNQLRYSNFYNQLNSLEQRVKYLSSKHNYLQEMTIHIEDLQSKIKKTNTENKDLKRKAKVVGKNIVNCTSALDKLILEENRLNRAVIRYRRFKQYLDGLANKQQKYKQRIRQTQDTIQMRIKQFSTQQNFIKQEIHYERYEQLKKQKQNLGKYESVYKRNYLMKLKQLETIVNSISKHDRIIQQNESNIMSLRGEIEQVSSLIGKTNYKKRSTSSMLQMSMNNGRLRSKQNKLRQDLNGSVMEEKNRGQYTARNRQNAMNDKNNVSVNVDRLDNI